MSENEFWNDVDSLMGVAEELSTEMKSVLDSLNRILEREDELSSKKAAHKEVRKLTLEIAKKGKDIRKLSIEFEKVSKDFRKNSVNFEKEM